MGRSNAIVVGAVVLGPLILGLEGYAAYRSHHHQPPTEVADPPQADSPQADSPQADSPRADSPQAEDQPASAPPAEVPPADPPAQTDPPPPDLGTVEAVAPTQNPALRQRFLEHRGKVIQAADELAFDVLNLPDAQRAAIRAIDDQFSRALATDADPNANQTRHSAIANVLGPDEAHAFNFAAHKAERRASGQLRTQVVRGE
jgi:hypothetical protein